jgi:hypothetical protein
MAQLSREKIRGLMRATPLLLPRHEHSVQHGWELARSHP